MAANRERAIEVFNTKILAGTVEDGLQFRRNADGSTVFSISSAGVLTMADPANIALGTTTGTKIGTATSQKLGFWNVTPVVQPATTATTSGFIVVGTSAVVAPESTFTGNTGSKAYTIGDIVLALKQAGIMAAS